MGYRGIIFNSVNVGLLNGELGAKVNELNIRTAVVSRKTRTECKKFMKSRGVSVDVVIGGHDLDTRYKQFGKPEGDSRVIASAMMFLNPSEVAVLGDYFGDWKSCYLFLYRGVSEKYQINTKIRVYRQRIFDI